jgi:hypothetical protein
MDLVNLWSVIIALVGENANKHTFFTRKQVVSLAEIKILLTKLPDRQLFDPESWDQIQQIIRFMILKTFEQEAEGLVVGTQRYQEQLDLLELQKEL